MKKLLQLSFILFLFMGILSCTNDKQENTRETIIKFGTLPVVQALPLFVAAEQGLFEEQGLKVELLAFNSALEKDIALTSGEISGYFGDMLTPTVLTANKIPMKMVATIFKTSEKQRMFAILVSPNSTKSDLSQIAEDGIAGSSNTVIDYITNKLVNPETNIKLIETKKIPIRLQMLLSNQVPAAALPEPLVTFAEMQGAKVIADDAGKNISSIVLSFTKEFIDAHPQEINKFLTAIEKARLLINKNPEKVRPIMNKFCRVPKPLQNTYVLPQFPKVSVPDSSQVMDIYNWLRTKKIITKKMKYSDMVEKIDY